MKKTKHSYCSGLYVVILCVIMRILPVMTEEEKSLACYQCGTGVAGEPDCSDFRLSPVWTPFRKECGSNMVCVKSLNYANKEVRGCTPKKSLFGDEHEDGCYTHQATGVMFCYCRVDLCNHVADTKRNNKLLGFSVIFITLVRLLVL